MNTIITNAKIGSRQMSLWDVLISPFRLLPKNPALLVPPLVDIGLKLLLTFLFYIFAAAYSGALVYWLLKHDLGFSYIQWLIGPCIAVVSFVIIQFLVTIFTSGWTYAMLDDIRSGGKVSIQNSFAIVRQGFGALIRYMLLSFFLALVLTASAGGIVYAIIASVHNVTLALSLGTVLSIVILIIAVGWVYGGPAIIKHQCGAFAGMAASWRFVWSGNFWRTIAIHLVAFVSGLVLAIFVPGVDLSLAATTFVFPLWLPYAYFKYGE
jgi:hypothetical protein